MNGGTGLIIGLTVIALGVGVVGLGFLEQEGQVRYVHDIVADPSAHATGSYTLLGMPQPPTLTGTGEGGQKEVANPGYRDQTRQVVRWWQDGVQHFSTLTLRVDLGDGTSHWSLQNQTRAPEHPDLAFPTTYENWTVQRPHVVFLIQGFEDRNGDTPYVFGIYEGVLRDPVQPKPSQFRGHVATQLPGGAPVPTGALLYHVDEYTAGCSSKFLPAEVRDDYADDPDIT